MYFYLGFVRTDLNQSIFFSFIIDRTVGLIDECTKGDFRMKEHFIKLKDGRNLAYLEYGKSDGDPVMIFHGTPGSKAWFLEDDQQSFDLGLRLISTDRPGYGTSDPKKGRTVLDWTDDVEELADQLGIDRFAVMGVSGGGPYAAACAYKIPQRLQNVTMVASSTPFFKGKNPKSMVKANRIGFNLGKYAPWILRLGYKAQKNMIQKKPEKYLELMKKSYNYLPDWDLQFLQTEEQLRGMMMHLSEALRVSVNEPANEIKLLTQPWGFNPEDIMIPVQIWHGEVDNLAPYEEILKFIPKLALCNFNSVPLAGHFLTEDSKIWESILQTIKNDFNQ
jgi:pimeloyl-ACP methyl ester carboxylesterase